MTPTDHEALVKDLQHESAHCTGLVSVTGRNLGDLLTKAATALESVTDELRTANRRIEGLETMRPVWDQGFTSENVAAQVTASALAGLWKILKAKNQTEAVLALESLAPRRQIDRFEEWWNEHGMFILRTRDGFSIENAEFTVKEMTREAWQSALAAAPPLTSPWQTMESAPRDGKFLIFWMTGKEPTVKVAYAMNGWIGYGELYTNRATKATHWQPLPAPPTEQDKP